MPGKKYDTNQPILLVVRRGRRGRGFTVAPVEDATNPAMCGSASELGEVIEEMLDDESQPRVDLDELINAGHPDSDDEKSTDSSSSNSESEGEEEYEDDEEEEAEEDGEGGILDGVAGSADPAEQILVNTFSWLASKGRSMSSKPRKPRARSRRRRTKTTKR